MLLTFLQGMDGWRAFRTEWVILGEAENIAGSLSCAPFMRLVSEHWLIGVDRHVWKRNVLHRAERNLLSALFGRLRWASVQASIQCLSVYDWKKCFLHFYGRQEESFPADAHVRVSPPLWLHDQQARVGKRNLPAEVKVVQGWCGRRCSWQNFSRYKTGNVIW